MEKALTVKDVMDLMGWKHKGTVYKQVNLGNLRAIHGVRPLRFTRRALEEFMEGQPVQSPVTPQASASRVVKRTRGREPEFLRGVPRLTKLD